MGKIFSPTGRRAAVALSLFLLVTMGLFSLPVPQEAAAQKVSTEDLPDYDAMMPRALAAAARKLDRSYHELMHQVNELQSQILARQAAGASAEELCHLDNQLTDMVNKAEKLKVQADYVNELYTTKEREYMGR